jgi:hypothetical protein
MYSITPNMSVCVHSSAQNAQTDRVVLRDVYTLNMLHIVICSQRNICNILARIRHITTRFGDVMHIYIY